VNKIYNPSTVAKPGGAYSHGIEVPANARWLFISGQLGISPNGKVREGTAAQAEQAWANIISILKDAGMGVGDLVKITTFITNAADVPVVRATREKAIGNIRPASTLLVIQALASPEYRIEIEAVAAKA
jgi:enamine deaminase RidA (YjgF/YER057c/UK114 family)